MMLNGKPLEGKTVLITGAAKRLGRAMALTLAEAGADVAITFLHSAREARNTVKDLQNLGVRALAIACDVTDETSVKLAIRNTIKDLGGIDILINNAANYETVEFEKLTLERWDAIFATNARGPFLVSREALKQLRERQGKIINMGSLGGIQPWSSHAHYCSSKAALHMLTRVMAKALAPEIAVNCVAPGMIRTRVWDRQSDGLTIEDRVTQLGVPLGRAGQPEEVASVIAFLLSPLASYVSGATVPISGGF